MPGLLEGILDNVAISIARSMDVVDVEAITMQDVRDYLLNP